MPGRSEQWGAGKGSGGENHMFPGMLGFVVGERWEACCQRLEIRLRGVEEDRAIFRTVYVACQRVGK